MMIKKARKTILELAKVVQDIHIEIPAVEWQSREIAHNAWIECQTAMLALDEVQESLKKITDGISNKTLTKKGEKNENNT